MRAQQRHHMINGRKTHHDIKDRQVGAAKNGAKQVNPEAGECEMQTTNNHKEQRHYMNQFHNKTILYEDHHWPAYAHDALYVIRR